MSHILRNLGLAAFVAVSAGAFMSGSAMAMSSHDCSVKWKAAQAAGTDGGMTYKDFRKAQCTDAAAAAPAAPAAATTAATPSGSFMKDCSAAWKGMKAANTIPAGMKFKEFVAGKCVVPATAAAPAPAAKAAVGKMAAPAAAMSAADCSAAWKKLKDANGVPAGMTFASFRSAGCIVGAPAAAAPATTAKAAPSIVPPEPTDKADATPLPTVDKNGKPLSPGRVAAIKRIRACADQYRTAKAANKLPANILALDSKHRWPDYWSACNKQLKAQGQ